MVLSAHSRVSRARACAPTTPNSNTSLLKLSTKVMVTRGKAAMGAMEMGVAVKVQCEGSGGGAVLCVD